MQVYYLDDELRLQPAAALSLQGTLNLAPIFKPVCGLITDNFKLCGAPQETQSTMRVELIGHFQPCMTDIFLHIDARMADYIRTHPYWGAAILRALQQSQCA